MSILATVLLALVAFGAALMQRVTGMGFALVSVPFFVIVYGPVNGVLLAMILGATGSMLILIAMWKSINWSMVRPIVAMAIIWVPIGAWVTNYLSETALLIVVGAAGIMALVGMRSKQVERVLVHRSGPYFAGALSSLMHVSSGLSGPPLVALAYSRRLSQAEFVVSVQVVFVVFHVMSLALRGLPKVPIAEVSMYVLLGLIGTGIGMLASRKISAPVARRATLVIAFLGTFVVLLKGLAQLGGLAV